MDAGVEAGREAGCRLRRGGDEVSRRRTVPTVSIRIDQRGDGECSWVVLVGDTIAASGLARTAALQERWRLWWEQPEQRAAARERITGG